ncbi:MAG TPA: O-methyltransferase [Phaeodactylibacter sp.]|nr:O-methyltransferase [Phaeodactylibacter sp.]
MNFPSPEILDYCELHSTPLGPVLEELRRETHLKTMAPQMLTGPVQGAFLQMLSKLLQPELIVEVGTFTGYSAICLAAGLREGGRLHTIEIDEELLRFGKKYYPRAGMEERIVQHLGDAREILPKLPDGFDLVFLDADKPSYAAYYEICLEKMKPGALLLADNVLWSGKVLNEKDRQTDEDTKALHAFNQMVQADPRVENFLLPLRDGLMMVRKVSETQFTKFI